MLTAVVETIYPHKTRLDRVLYLHVDSLSVIESAVSGTSCVFHLIHGIYHMFYKVFCDTVVIVLVVKC